MAGRLDVVGQHLVRIAPGDEDVGADDLGRIAGPDADEFGRRSIEPAGDADHRRDQEDGKPFCKSDDETHEG